ncbi:MAG: family 78 glycoside hydrolase catalytic domain [Bacteroidetes bacterium]|nr:family 78 glycoside hydrolase catalytic domain [Bacteroidota bacterium]
MKKLILTLILFLTLKAQAQVHVDVFRTENLQNPIGITEAQPRFSWQLLADRRNVLQTAYEIRVSSTAAGLSKGDQWNSGKVSSDRSTFVAYAGKPLQSGKEYYWQVRVWDDQSKASNWSIAQSFQMGLLQKSDWKAQWIAPTTPEDKDNRPSPLMRKTFSTSKKVTSATAYITAHGMYEAFLNGKRIGDAYLSPGWTSYNKRLQYQVYDVTPLVTQGNNAVGVMLGSGWYRGFIGFDGQHDYYGKKLGLLFQLDITYSDGSHDLILSDGSWKNATASVLASEIYHGETIDARLEKTGWNTSGYDDLSWTAVEVTGDPLDNLVATYNEPIRKHEAFSVKKVITTPKGEKVLDFGQNLVGWVQVKIRGNAGDRITLYHAEVLDKEGNFYTENLRPAKQKNQYILKGGSEELFEPHFTFQGFRYVRIEDFPGEIKPENFTAITLYSDMRPTGTFTSSHPLINQLQHNIQWGQRGNFLDVPTDCPQRDERLGWTGDAQAFSRTAAFNYDVHNFFMKWLKDVEADQVNGSVPFVVPNVLGPGAVGSTGWADAATIIPWDMYLAYGDKKVLENQYESMKAWVAFMDGNSTHHLWNKGFHFGDWLFYRPFDDNDGRSAVTDKYLIAQCFFAHSVELILKTAKVLGRTDDVDRYTTLLKDVKDAFMKEYVTPSGRLVSGTQTAYVLALNFDMLPESMRADAARKLAENIQSYDNHLTTGFLGTPYLCHVLSRFGYNDLAYTLLMQESYPSWLYPVKMGATTIWERWDGIKPDGTFQTPGMNSFNHYAYGAIGDWMYRAVTGLDTDEKSPGYKSIIIKPILGKQLTSASSELNSPYGKIRSSWKTAGESVSLDVEIPANATATIFIPSGKVESVKEGGKPVNGVKGMNPVLDGSYIKVQVGSGIYRFEATR